MKILITILTILFALEASAQTNKKDTCAEIYQQQEDQVNEYMRILQLPYHEAAKKKDTVKMIEIVNSSTIKWRDSMANMQANFIIKYPACETSLKLMGNLLSVKPISTVDSLLQLVEKTALGQAPLAVKIRGIINTRLSLRLGGIAPDFSQPDTSGRPVTLSDFKGKYVLLDFWASWCAPCRAENPNVLKAYHQYKDRNFTVLAVSLDENRGSWIKAIKEDNLPWSQVSDLKAGNEAGKRYAVTAIPYNFLIDPSGHIVAINLRGEALQQKLAELLTL